MNTSKGMVALLMVMGLTGCTIVERDRGYVQREWSMTLRELGISPIFPPREDVTVGDIYAFDYDPDSTETRRLFETKWGRLSPEDQRRRLELGMSPRLARLSPKLAKTIEDEYRHTVSAPATAREYNSILGNPALASASDQVEAAETKLKKLKDRVAAAKKDAADAQRDLLDATREKQDKNAAVTIVEEKLNSAKAMPPDTSVQEAQLKAAKANLRLKEDAVTRAVRALEDAGTDPAKKEQAAKDVAQANRDKADAQVAVQRAQEDLEAAKLVKPDLSNLESDLASAKSNQRAAADNVTRLQRISDDKVAAATATEQEQAGPIEEATKDVAAAQAIWDVVATAGAKMVYMQPCDAQWSVYTGTSLPNPDGGADDLVNSRINRLRLVAFPEFATTTFTQGDLSALIPIEAMMVGLNISSANVAKVSVKVPAAESYTLSLNKVIDQIVDQDRVVEQDKVKKVWKLKHELLQAGQFQLHSNRVEVKNDRPDGKPSGSQGEEEKIVYFRVVTEVFYARAMDITLFSAGSFGARVPVGPPVPAAGAAPASTASPTPVAAVDSSAAASASATAMLTSIQNRLAMTQTVPGGSVQVVSYSDRSIGLRRVFDRPIAIGTRGLVLAVDQKGTVRNVSVGGGAVSTR